MSSLLRVLRFIPHHEIVPVKTGLFVGSVRIGVGCPPPSKPLTAGEKAKQNWSHIRY